MKVTRAIYWTSTVLFAAVFALTGTLYLIHNPQMVTKLALLGYPPYMVAILGTAKILGAITLVVPKFPRLKGGLMRDLSSTFSVQSGLTSNANCPYEVGRFLKGFACHRGG